MTLPVESGDVSVDLGELFFEIIVHLTGSLRLHLARKPDRFVRTKIDQGDGASGVFFGDRQNRELAVSLGDYQQIGRQRAGRNRRLGFGADAFQQFRGANHVGKCLRGNLAIAENVNRRRRFVADQLSRRSVTFIPEQQPGQ